MIWWFESGVGIWQATNATASTSSTVNASTSSHQMTSKFTPWQLHSARAPRFCPLRIHWKRRRRSRYIPTQPGVIPTGRLTSFVKVPFSILRNRTTRIIFSTYPSEPLMVPLWFSSPGERDESRATNWKLRVSISSRTLLQLDCRTFLPRQMSCCVLYLYIEKGQMKLHVGDSIIRSMFDQIPLNAAWYFAVEYLHAATRPWPASSTSRNTLFASNYYTPSSTAHSWVVTVR